MLPMMDINLHFNGDFHAVSSAQPVGGARLTTRCTTQSVAARSAARDLKRVVDMNDRALRDIIGSAALGRHPA